jgi:hypothetical protein
MGRKSCRKCCKPKKEKVNLKVRCRPAYQDCEADAGEWNLAIFPEESRSTFRPTPNEDTDGQYTVFGNATDNHANFTSVGLGNASEADLLNTRYTLEVPAAPNALSGFSIYFTINGDYIKFIQNDIVYDDRLTGRVCNTNIVEAGNAAPPASAEYEGWTFITHENE